MKWIGRILSLAILMMAVSACGGSSPFRPSFGPFTGNLLVGEDAVGSITLTSNQGLIGGTGVLTHRESEVTVSIACSINGQTITGTISNTLLGSGPFEGEFVNADVCHGTFSYTDTTGLDTTTGTWRAELQ